MKTAKESLSELFKQRNLLDDVGYLADSKTNRYIEGFILDAMDNHAKNVAVEFQEWIRKNNWIYSSVHNGWHQYQPTNTFLITTWKTTEELYSLFLNEAK